MITLMVVLFVFLVIAFLVALINGLIAIAPILLVLLLLPVIDYLVLKKIFGKKK